MKEPGSVTTISKKVCLLGDFAVGKTSLVRQFVYSRFEEHYLSTIGVHVSRKALSVPHPAGVVDLAILLWDIAGNNGFEKVRASYIRGSAGVLLVCDLTRPETLDSLLTYVDLVRNISPDARMIMAANKCDLIDERQLTTDQIWAVAQRLNTPFYLTSAKTSDAVETIFRELGGLLVE
jgi:small GTP-binding protein